MKLLDGVLWVEDQPEFVDSLMPLVETVANRVVHARDATEAERFLASEAFDLLLLDLQLPPGRWGGLDLLRRLAKGSRSFAVVVISGAGTLAQCVEAMQLGAEDYLQKEDARAELAEKLRGAVERFKQHQPLADYQRICAVEQRLKDLVMGTLRESAASTGQHIWRSLVPRKVALKSYERWLDAKEGEQYEFFDLLDWAETIDARRNDEISGLLKLRSVLEPKRREDWTGWLKALNEARKVIAHPSRGELGDHQRKAIERAEEVIDLWLGVRTSAGGGVG